MSEQDDKKPVAVKKKAAVKKKTVSKKKVTTKAAVKQSPVKKAAPKKRAPATKRAAVKAATSVSVTSDKVSPRERYEMIQTMAYYRAERRNFEAGYSMEDWLEAERLVNKMLENQ